jgi:DNA segregation ATPase FtsK/SpoIIIE, S-DNA-T family
MVSPPVLPGRGIEAASGLHVQVCLPPESLPAPARAQGGGPKLFPPLPGSVPLSRLEGAAVGVGGPDVVPVELDLFDLGPHLVLVSGPPGSGRSNAALVMATVLLRAGVHVLALGPPRSPLVRSLPGAHTLAGTTFADADLREAVTAFEDEPYAVVVDDFDQVTITATEQGFDTLPTLLRDILAPAELGRRALVLAGDATPLLEGHRRSLSGEAAEVLRSGSRFLLTPTSRVHAREHGFTLEPDQFFAGPPGRAYLNTARRLDLVQFAVL